MRAVHEESSVRQPGASRLCERLRAPRVEPDAAAKRPCYLQLHHNLRFHIKIVETEDSVVIRSRLLTPGCVPAACNDLIDSGRLCRGLQRRRRLATQRERDHYPSPAAENQANCEREPDEP
jgi:hypothetical protein